MKSFEAWREHIKLCCKQKGKCAGVDYVRQRNKHFFKFRSAAFSVTVKIALIKSGEFPALFTTF